MREGDPIGYLVGREEDSEKVIELLRETSVLIFTGASGVGKSSVLQLGLLPTLKEAGCAVIVCNDWSRSSEAPSVDSFIHQQTSRQFTPLQRLSLGDGADLLSRFDQLHGEDGVIVLDQFEELIRYQRRDYRKVLDWIERAAAETKVRIVISLRAEYEHELRGPFGLKLGPFQQTRYELPPITSRSLIEKILASGSNDNGRPAAPAGPEGAAKLVADAWEHAGVRSGETGLLHLQALLYLLWQDPKRGGDTIERADVLRAYPRLVSSTADGDKVDPEAAASCFESSLVAAVEVSLNACQAACRPDSEKGWSGVDPTLAARSLALAREMSGFLSSGGYKLSQAREELANLSLVGSGSGGLIKHLGAVESARENLARLVDDSSEDPSDDSSEDWLSTPRRELGLAPVLGVPWVVDEHDLTGGVLLGLRPEDSLLEEFRSFYFALEWLKACHLVRVTTPFRGRTMVTLIHDLFGEGLVAWCQSVRGGALAAVQQFAGVRGLPLSWEGAGSGSGGEPVVVNLRWRSCDVHADFLNVTFVNCDFRGTRFVGCAFEGVSFVNCMMDDVELRNCVVRGAPSSSFAAPAPASSGPEEADHIATTDPAGPPAYFISFAAPSVVTSLMRYREERHPSRSDPIGVYSHTAGVAAVPGSRPSGVHVIDLAPVGRGLAFVGGRISSLKIRACRFVDGGRMAIRQTAGTSIELADQLRAFIDVEGAAIRGLTITRPLNPDDPRWADQLAPGGSGDDEDRFEINFRYSRAINVWFGQGLKGFADFDDCFVVQVVNAAERDSFAVTTTNTSNAYGMVNVEPFQAKDSGDPSWLEPPTSTSLGGLTDRLSDTSRATDYRERPLPIEIEAWLTFGTDHVSAVDSEAPAD
jgi:hypothetical protein